MKIALLHYTSWPHVGGVENFIRDQATLLARKGHEVQVLAGEGENPNEGYDLQIIPEIALDFPLNAEVRAVLNRGQFDQKFTQYRSLLVAALQPYLARVDFTIVHNVFTMHFNLALTQALHDLSAQFPFIAWTNDLIATNSDYSLPNPGKTPWSLVRTTVPKVTYVTVSEVRKNEMEAYMTPVPEVKIVPDIIDLARHFHLTEEMKASLETLNLSDRDFIFFLPAARITPRKNIEFAIEIIKEIKAKGLNPLLFITGSGDRQNPSGTQYSQYLRACIPAGLKRSVVFVNDHFTVGDKNIRDFYLLSDCLLFPPRQEGFGLPIIEAALYRMPIWCSKVPAFWALEGEGMFMMSELSQLSEALNWLEMQPAFRLQRLVRRTFDMERVYRNYYAPLFEEVMQKK